jgi:hypothetical protein
MFGLVDHALSIGAHVWSDMLSHFSQSDMLSHFSQSDMLSHFSQSDMLSHFSQSAHRVKHRHPGALCHATVASLCGFSLRTPLALSLLSSLLYSPSSLMSFSSLSSFTSLNRRTLMPSYRHPGAVCHAKDTAVASSGGYSRRRCQ